MGLFVNDVAVQNSISQAGSEKVKDKFIILAKINKEIQEKIKLVLQFFFFFLENYFIVKDFTLLKCNCVISE